MTNPDDPPDGDPGPSQNSNQADSNAFNKTSKPKKQLQYVESDIGPYQVMIESSNVFSSSDKEQKQTDSANKKGNLHIGRLSHLSVAKKILDMKLQSIVKMEKKGKNRLCVTFRTWEAANEFLGNKSLLDKGYEMFVPANLVSCKGIVKYVDLSFTEEELIEYSRVERSGADAKLISVKRFNRRTEEKNQDGSWKYVPTSTVLFTFTGKLLPKFVNICMLPMPIEPYILPVIQCNNCLLYGHTKNNCNGRTKCQACSKTQDKHIEGECKTYCLFCQSDEHRSTDRRCPEYARQRLIREIMSLDNLSFYDANLRAPKAAANRTYISRSQDFPSLMSDKNSENAITIGQRRNFVSRPIVTYSHMSQSSRKRKPTSPISPGYDLAAHNNCLDAPNGRLASTLPPGSAFPNTTQRQTLPEPSGKISASVDTLLGIFENLTVPEREQVLAHLNNLNNDSHSNVSDAMSEY